MSSPSPSSPLRSGASPAAQMLAAFGPGFPLAVVGGGGVLVGAMLLLSARTARRGARCAEVIGAAERAVLRDARVRSVVGGHVLAGGSYELQAADTQALGWFSASGPGRARARVMLEATRADARAEWTFRNLRLEVDRRALAERAAERRAVAVAAGRVAADEPLPPPLEGTPGLDNEDVVVFVVTGEVRAPPPAAAEAPLR